MFITKIINSFYSISLKLIGVFSSALLVIFIQKIAGTEMQGYYALLFNLTHVATIFCIFGVPSFLTREISEIRTLALSDASTRIGKILKISISSIAFVFFLVAPLVFFIFISLGLDYHEAFIALLIVWFNIYIYLFACFVRGFNHFNWMIFITESSRFLLSLFFVIAIFLFSVLDRKTILYSLLLASAVSFVQAILVAKKNTNVDFHIRKINTSGIKKCLKGSMPLMLSSFTILCMQQSNVIQVSLYSSFHEAGLFNFANKLMAFSVMPISIINAIYGQKASEIYISSGLTKAKEMLIKVTTLSFFSCVVSILVINLFSPYIYNYVGQSFNVKLLMILSLTYLFFSVYGFGITFLGMINMAKPSAYIMMLTLMLNFFLSYILIPSYGAIGAAMSDALSHGIAMLMLLSFVTFNLK